MNNIFISGFDIETNNRGTQALSYGSVAFLKLKRYIDDETQLIAPGVYLNPIKHWKNSTKYIKVIGNTGSYNVKHQKFWIIDIKFVIFFYRLFNKIISITPFGREVKKAKVIAAICGGDGFSDIYSIDTMNNHLKWIQIAQKMNLPYVFLPQTIGPFSNIINKNKAEQILKGAQAVYVRDNVIVDQLEEWKVVFDVCDDLSKYMEPQPCNFLVLSNAIGVNISGLCYYDSFYNLKDQFKNYKKLILRIIQMFQEINVPIYLIPHSYNFHNPENEADDLLASVDFFSNLENKENVYLINQNLQSPEIKYIISKMSFFVGSRLHSCFAAIFTNTPTYGLAYSYKYEGAFAKYNLINSFSNIKGLNHDEIDVICKKILNKYYENFSNGIHRIKK